MFRNLLRKSTNEVLKQSGNVAKPRYLPSAAYDSSVKRDNFRNYSILIASFTVNSATKLSVPKNVLRNILFKRTINASQATLKKEIVTVNFVKANGEKITTQGKEGDSLLDVVVDKNIDIDGFGACEGTLACSTCHLIFSQEDFNRIKDKPTDEELDMLDLAFGLTDTSRLGCQVILAKQLNGLEIKIPDTINDARN